MVTFIVGLDVPFFSVPNYSFCKKVQNLKKLEGLLPTLNLLLYGNPIGLILAGPFGGFTRCDRLFVYLGLAIILNGELSFVRVYKSESEYINKRKQ